MDRNKLLQIILDYVYPLELVPLKFQSLERDEYIFFAKECSEAIHKLCANNLIIPNPYDRMSPVSRTNNHQTLPFQNILKCTKMSCFFLDQDGNNFTLCFSK